MMTLGKLHERRAINQRLFVSNTYRLQYVEDSKKKKTKTIHIGISCSGWCFGLYAYPTLNLHSWVDWCIMLTRGKILDEQNNEIAYEWFVGEIVTNRKGHDRFHLKDNEHIKSGYAVYDSKLNLLRTNIGQGGCLSHGEGSWDMLLPQYFDTEN